MAGKRIILNVDENVEMLKLLENTIHLTCAIKGYQWKIVSAKDAHYAKHVMDTERQIDLAIFNVGNSVEKGYELAETFREKFKLSPIFLQSWQETEQTREQLTKLDKAEFLSIPFDLIKFRNNLEKKMNTQI